jgi:osmotically-inducible protein OsmY
MGQTSEDREFPVGDRGPFKGPGPARPDDDIRSDVESALFYDEFVNPLDIKVTVQRGSVTLTGTVNSERTKRRAGEDAWRVAGVRNVMNDLAAIESPIPSRAVGQDEIPAIVWRRARQ